MERGPANLETTLGEVEEAEVRPIGSRRVLPPGSCLPGEVVNRPWREARGVLKRAGREAKSDVRLRRNGWFRTSTARSQGNTVTKRDT